MADKKDWKDIPEEKRGRVLVMYTGGTIGMKDFGKGEGFEPAPGFIHETLASLSMFHDHEFGTPTEESISDFTFVTPLLKAGKRAVYRVLEYVPILDSCNIGLKDWVRIARDIEAHYADWDAFIVLHGTDTMSYTASALSFMLENLGKTVVVTGAQVPLSVPLNDGINNLLGSLTVAAHYETPEVLLHFNGKSMRGNRTTKGNASGLAGFISANFRPLIDLGVDYKVDWHRVLPPPEGPFRVCDSYEGHVAIFRLFPGFKEDELRNVLRPPLKGLVLQTFGAGNAPDNAVPILQEATKRGVIVVNVTQCQKGTVEAHYAVGVALRRVGVLPGYDMTVEAALTKLGHLLGLGVPKETVMEMLEQDLRGELTLPEKAGARFSFTDNTFISSVYSALHKGAKAVGARAEGEMAFIVQALNPVLMCSAAGEGNLQLLQEMVGNGADVNAADYDDRTPLHVAASEGHLEVCKLLVQSGSYVNIKDKHGHSPLFEAVNNGHIEVAEFLVQSQGVLQLKQYRSATLLLNAATEGEAEVVDRWCRFGVSVSVSDYDRRTAGHIAACEGHGEVLKVLKKHGALFDVKDRWGSTAIDEATKHHPNLLSLMS